MSKPSETFSLLTLFRFTRLVKISDNTTTKSFFFTSFKSICCEEGWLLLFGNIQSKYLRKLPLWNFYLGTCLADNISDNIAFGCHSPWRLNIVSRVLFTSQLHSSALKLGKFRIDPSCQLYLPWAEKNCSGCSERIQMNGQHWSWPTHSQLSSCEEQMTRGCPWADTQVNDIHKENIRFFPVLGLTNLRSGGVVLL